MKVKIYKISRKATQSGYARCGVWVVEPDGVQKNLDLSIMGWNGAKDFINNQHKMFFSSKENAINFATNNSYQFYLIDKMDRVSFPKSYLDNYK